MPKRSITRKLEDQALCPNWVFSPKSNVHISKHREWFATYQPFSSRVRLLDVSDEAETGAGTAAVAPTTTEGKYLEVVGIGTVFLPTKTSPYVDNPHLHRSLELQLVLHCPDAQCNMVGNVPGCTYTTQPTGSYDKGFILSDIGNPIAYFDSQAPLLQLMLSGHPFRPKTGRPSILSEEGCDGQKKVKQHGDQNSDDDNIVMPVLWNDDELDRWKTQMGLEGLRTMQKENQTWLVRRQYMLKCKLNIFRRIDREKYSNKQGKDDETDTFIYKRFSNVLGARLDFLHVDDDDDLNHEHEHEPWSSAGDDDGASAGKDSDVGKMLSIIEPDFYGRPTNSLELECDCWADPPHLTDQFSAARVQWVRNNSGCRTLRRFLAVMGLSPDSGVDCAHAAALVDHFVVEEETARKIAKEWRQWPILTSNGKTRNLMASFGSCMCDGCKKRLGYTPVDCVCGPCLKSRRLVSAGPLGHPDSTLQEDGLEKCTCALGQEVEKVEKEEELEQVVDIWSTTEKFACPNWVFVSKSNVHIAKDRCWFASYRPFVSKVTSGTTSYPVIGVGTVILHVDHAGIHPGTDTAEFPAAGDRNYVELQDVLHCPSAPYNYVGQKQGFSVEMRHDWPAAKGYLMNKDGVCIAYFARNLPLLQLQLHSLVMPQFTSDVFTNTSYDSEPVDWWWPKCMMLGPKELERCRNYIGPAERTEMEAETKNWQVEESFLFQCQLSIYIPVHRRLGRIIRNW